MTKKNRTNYKSKPVEKEMGCVGIAISNGKVKEDTLRSLRGPEKIKKLEEMVNFDSTIGAFNNMYLSLASSVKWSVKPKDESEEAKKQEEFINSCLFEDLNGSFIEMVNNALTASTYGFAIVEPVYKVRNGKKNDEYKSSMFDDGLIGLSKLAPRYQGSIYRWNYDEHYQNIVSITQKDPNNFDYVEIPYKKLLHFKHRSFNNNPEGKSLYCNCVKAYNKKERTSIQEDIRYERGFDGLLKIKAPAAYLDPTSQNPKHLATQQWIQDTIQNIKNGTDLGVALPEKIDLEILNAGVGQLPDADKMIERADRNIATALLSDFFLSAQKSGASSSANSKIKLFTNLVKEMLNEVRRVVNEDLIRTLIKKNMMNEEFMPTIEFSEIGSDLNLTDMMLLLQSANKNKLVPPTLELCNTIMRRVFGNDAPTISQETFDNYQVREETQTQAYTSQRAADTLIEQISDEDKVTPEVVEEANTTDEEQ